MRSTPGSTDSRSRPIILGDLVAGEWLHPAIVRRLDDMCRVIEL
jgi:hypothetical protein